MKAHKFMTPQTEDALESEIDYQKAQGADHIKPTVSLGEQILIMEHNLAKARELWYRNTGDDYVGATNFIRKVTATGIVAMNHTGVQRREGY